MVMQENVTDLVCWNFSAIVAVAILGFLPNIAVYKQSDVVLSFVSSKFDIGGVILNKFAIKECELQVCLSCDRECARQWIPSAINMFWIKPTTSKVYGRCWRDIVQQRAATAAIVSSVLNSTL